MTPELFGRVNGQSAVTRQPTDDAERVRAMQAASACPTGSIRTEVATQLAKTASESFPKLCVDARGNHVHGVFYNGHTAEQTFGASSWLVTSPECNVMIDCPRFSPLLAARIQNVCNTATTDSISDGRTLNYLLLTHTDDVYGHAQWQKHTKAVRIIHESECNSQQGTTECEIQLRDADLPYKLSATLTIVHVPGHTRGSLALLDSSSRSLFSGDHVWGSMDHVLTASPTYCSYSWPRQVDSIAKMADLPFLHLWPGHGRPVHFEDAAHRQAAVGLAVDRLANL